MKLSDLEGCFRRIVDERTIETVDSLADAQGVEFLCPKCFAANGGSIGTSHVLVWFKGRGVPDSYAPGPGRWTIVSGSGLGDLTLVPSIHLTGSEVCMPRTPDGKLTAGWHGFVTNGNAT